jgi:thioredoxin reductase
MGTYKVAVIGAGPAGIAAAIQLKRFGIDPLVFEAEQIGGLLLNANLVENYPGFPGGISGIDLGNLMKAQFIDHNISLMKEKVLSVKYTQEKDNFELSTEKNKFSAEYLVVASGTKPRKLIEFEYLKANIHYEVKELAGFIDKHVVIIGAGDAAFDYAVNLSETNTVTILNRGTEKKCLPLLWDRSKNIKQITYMEKAQISSVENISGKLKFKVDHAGELCEIIGDKLLVAIGREPELSFFSKETLIKKDELISKERLYFIGDVKNKIFRQTTIAVGDGVLTAMKIYQKILEGGA